MRGFRHFSAHVTKCHACHGICTLSPLRAALTMGVAKKHATRHVSSAAPATQKDDGGLQSAAPAMKTATHLVKTTQKYCACHIKRLSTHYETRWNVTQCHACHVKRSYATRHLKPPKVPTLAELAIGTAILPTRRSLANSCRRLRAPKQRQANMSPPPDSQSKTKTLCYAFGKKIFKGNGHLHDSHSTSFNNQLQLQP